MDQHTISTKFVQELVPMNPLVILFYGLYRTIRRRGGVRRLYHFNKKIIKRNPIPTVMLIIIFGMSFLLINANVKIVKLRSIKETPLIEIVREVEYVNCDSTDNVGLSKLEKETNKEEGPVVPSSATGKAILPTIRRYTSDKLSEISRGLESESE